MILFLNGPDDYRRYRRGQFYTHEFQKKHGGLGVECFDLKEDGNFEKFEEFVSGQSLFATHKMASIENVFSDDRYDLRVLLQHVAKMGAQTTVLISERGGPTEDWKFLLKDPVRSEAFDVLSGAQWKTFVVKAAEEFGARISPHILAPLLRVYEGDSWGVVTELQKLASLGNREVRESDLEHLDFGAAPDFWALVNGLKNTQQKIRLATVERMLSRGESAAKLFNIAAYQLPGKLAQFAGYDLAIKSGKLEYEEALLDAILL